MQHRTHRPPLVAPVAPVALVLAALGLAPTGTAAAAADDDDIDRELRLLRESSGRPRVEIGDHVPGFVVRAVSGEDILVGPGPRRAPVAVVFLSTTCPLAKRYVERLKRLDTEFSSRGVRLIAIFPNADETEAKVREYAEKAGFGFPIVRDVHGYAARRLGAAMTPQAFLLDGESMLAYRGAIDDHRYENRVRERYLRDGIAACLAGRAVAEPRTLAVGCSVHLPEDPRPREGEPITYTTHVARILQDRCQSCHRPGQVGPFSLTSYREARRWRREIRTYTRERLMPPWKAAPGIGRFRNDMSLTEREISLISRWVEAGAPEGPAADRPPDPVFPEGWAYGEPDMVFEMPEEYVVAPEGEDDYRHFVIPYELDGPRFIEAVDVQPGNRSTVHHVLAYVDTSGKARELDAADPGPGYTRFGGVGFQPASVVGGWAPGNLPVKLRAGTGRRLPPKGDLVIQVHYYRTGLEERDRTRLGVYFSRAKSPVPVRGGVAVQREFTIPAGEKRYEVSADLTLEEPVYAFSVTPHMHLLGQTIRVTATRPDGTEVPLVRIDDWDFNWQTSYHFRDLIRFPAGTRIEVVGTFDNSSDNPDNPHDPPRPVTWGERTTDEMCLAFVSWYRESELARHPHLVASPSHQAAGRP